MATVQMKCPNCGGTMALINNQFRCSYCRTTILNIIDAKIDADVTVMSPDEFARKLEESKRQFVVNINDNLKVFDVNTMVINKKIQDATLALDKGDFSAVLSILEGLHEDILSVERLRFLAELKVKNEYELSFHDGYIDTINYSYGKSDHYSNIIKLADEQTRATYQKLAKYCREQYDTKKHIEAEITEVNKLLSVKLYQEALAYTKKMCRKYPQTALSWAYACEVKCNISSNYNGNFEFSMMKKCPDYSEAQLPSALKNKISNFVQLSNSYSNACAEHTTKLGCLAACMWGAVLAFALSNILMNRNNGGIFLIGWVLYVVFLVCGIASIVCTCKSISAGKSERKIRKHYNAEINLIPNQIKEQYKANCSKSKRKLFRFAIEFCFLAIAISIFVIVKMFS